MAKHWIAGAIKHPGALTKKATTAGQSPMAFAAAHKGDSGTTGKQAQLALTLQGFHSHLPSGVKQTPEGDIGQHRQVEAKILNPKFFAKGGGQIISASRYFKKG